MTAQEEESIKVEDEVMTLISETEIEDGREVIETTQMKEKFEVAVEMRYGGEAGELTQLRVDVDVDVVEKVEAGEQTQFEVDVVEKGEAGELTQLKVEVDVDVVEKREAGEANAV